ncbi:ribosome biogenesis GTPase YqeH [Aerococcus kribbianus]|uniref:Ribosome biogenesis GTPase YqeH n=1 Tax=Aerococcus kribbianus TaxID=2999064 RepID=A0A9X3JG60_9LACT|nr:MULTISPECIES: ribosome biogenesis GTPase YqeH [unclassified Aerococcus]MCZ0717727.1 ribosome biogenesis GTPase YqeH [Aerococcus sp. YH-aer221]MCZ0726015.1 ribosome biogenesis GTPase YqeH [Aerococcus sp. YH-aer222]
MTKEEAVYCIGCGARLQSEQAGERGYTPQSSYDKGIETGELYCQRCFKLRHYNQLEKVSTSEDEFLALLNDLSNKDALIVNVIDIFDVSGSIISGLNRFTGDNPVLLVANKLDLLPKSLNPNRLQNWLQGQLKDLGIKVDDILLLSAKKRKAVDELLDKIESMRHGKDVYIMGVTNVGKSTIINRLLQSTGVDAQVITTSQYPGTTLDLIEIPFEDDSVLVDTPGIIHSNQMTSLLDLDDLKLVMPADELRPRTYQLNDQQTLFMGGLARFDYLSGEKMGITAYFSRRLDIHRRKLEGSDEFYDKHLGGLLTPPQAGTIAEFPTLVRREFHIRENTDLVISGLGWLNIPKAADIAIHVPRGIAVYLRSPLI